MSVAHELCPMSSSRIDRPALLSWALMLTAFFGTYGLTFNDLMKGLWQTDQNSHGPIVLAVAVWFLIHQARLIAAQADAQIRPRPWLGWPLMLLGALFYAVGRSQALVSLEVASIIPMLLGAVLLLFGTDVAKRLWFAFFFLFFMIPMPGSVIDAATQPMKILVSIGAENLMAMLGYPVARSGVVLYIGQYQLLVADACAGLNSLFTLEALGLLYMNVVRHSSVVRNAVLATLIVPISFTANTLRVLILALITYYFGDEAGQGFLHEFSGMVLFMTALMLIIGLDSLLRFGVHAGGRVAGRNA